MTWDGSYYAWWLLHLPIGDLKEFTPTRSQPLSDGPAMYRTHIDDPHRRRETDLHGSFAGDPL